MVQLIPSHFLTSLLLSELGEENFSGAMENNQFVYLVGHAEDFLTSASLKYLASAPWAKLVKFIFFDEVHTVVTWSEGFRPELRRAGVLKVFFENALVVGKIGNITYVQKNSWGLLALGSRGFDSLPHNMKVRYLGRQSTCVTCSRILHYVTYTNGFASIPLESFFSKNTALINEINRYNHSTHCVPTSYKLKNLNVLDKGVNSC